MVQFSIFFFLPETVGLPLIVTCNMVLFTCSLHFLQWPSFTLYFLKFKLSSLHKSIPQDHNLLKWHSIFTKLFQISKKKWKYINNSKLYQLIHSKWLLQSIASEIFLSVRQPAITLSGSFLSISCGLCEKGDKHSEVMLLRECWKQ